MMISLDGLVWLSSNQSFDLLDVSELLSHVHLYGFGRKRGILFRPNVGTCLSTVSHKHKKNLSCKY